MSRIVVVALLAGVGVLGPATSGGAVSVTRDVEYGQAGGQRLLLDVYRPGGGGPHPAVLAVHGGRWAYGDKSDIPGEEFAKLGFVVFAIDYRLAPDHPYPAAIEDVRTAMRWVRDHAQEYGANPGRIWALGGSAGGHLVGLLATDTTGEARPGVTVSYSGPMDLEALADSGGSAEKAVREFLGCSKWDKACRKVAREASPITHVDPSDPPMYLANGTDEPIPLDQATSMVEALEQAQVDHRFRKIEGNDHAFQYLRQVIEPSTTFAAQHLGGAVPPPGGDSEPDGEGDDQGQPGEEETGDGKPEKGDRGGEPDETGSPTPERTEGSPRAAAPREGADRGGGWSWVLAVIVAAAVGGAVLVAILFFREPPEGGPPG